MPESIGLYIHVPFCLRKCRYCSFISYERREADIPLYVGALKKELAQRVVNIPVASIYFGGGTPSLLKIDQLEGILSTINSCYEVNSDAEISMEANPGTVNKTYLTTLRNLGINRLSLGVQSLNDSELKLLGRIHTAIEAKQTLERARQSGFENCNLDFIYGLPGQSLTDWKQTLMEAIELKPEHLSLYALTLEEEVPLQQAIKRKELPEIDPDMEADQYEMAEDLLACAGYRHYEISNWAKPDYTCRHNLTYWQNRPYLGIGVAAHSCLNGHRTANMNDLDKYLESFFNGDTVSPEMDEVINPDLALAETIILGLRLDDGVSVSTDVSERYSPQISEMVGCGLMEREANHLKLTSRGRLLSNEVFWRFLP